MDINLTPYVDEAWNLLEDIIAIPATSMHEQARSAFLYKRLHAYGLTTQVVGNNLYSFSPRYLSERKTILLNAHIDTVQPVPSWTYEPYHGTIVDDRMYGLGTNDCGGGLVSIIQLFRILYTEEIGSQYNFILLLSCEEEISGANGIQQVLPLLPHVDVAIVAEPTSLQPAIAEKGLLVLDLTSRGHSCHAAHYSLEEGKNAIYAMMDDINWLRSYGFEKKSELLGDTIMQVTQITAGTQHNVIPDVCRAVLDVRTNEHYSNQEVFDIIRSHVHCEVTPRSLHLGSSHIDPSHPLIEKCVALGLTPFGSPTLSDQALLPFPSFKLGPGDSRRSHTADEYITLSEIQEALELYIKLLS